MIESEKGESCVLTMASSKAAHKLLGTKGLGNNNSSQFEQGDTLSSGGLITLKMTPPDSAKLCKKLTDNCVQNNSTSITVAPGISIKKVLTEPLNGKPVAAVVTTKQVNNETCATAQKTECTALEDSEETTEQENEQCSELTSPCNRTSPNSVQSKCNQQETQNDKHKWPSEENVTPHQNSGMLKNLSKLLNTKNVKLKLPSPSSLSSSREDLDDVSIDLTEEEEDALLGKPENSDVERDAHTESPHIAKNCIETEAEEGSDKLDSTDEWKVLDETEASTCSSEHSPRVSVGGSVSPGSAAISPYRSTPKVAKPESGGEKKEESDFNRLCNNINSKITRLAILGPQPTIETGSKLKPQCDNLKSTDSVIKNCENNLLPPPQESSTKKPNSQTEKKNIIINENLFDKYAKEKLVTTKVSDIAFVPEDDSDDEKELKFKSSLWNFVDDTSTDSNPPNKPINISFFDNTATEDGMQLAVDKVVQKILTEISDDSDTNEVSNLSNKLTRKSSEHRKESSLAASTVSTISQMPDCMEVLKTGSVENSLAETTKPENLVTPKSGGADVPKPGGSEVPEAEGAEVPEAGVAEVPKTEVADALVAEDAEVPKAEGAELPQAEGAEVPKVGGAEIPKIKGAEVPVVEEAEVPTAEAAVAPTAEGACVPEPEGSVIAKAESSNIPNAEGAAVPMAESADLPLAQGADMPKAEVAQDSDTDVAKVPKVEIADVPKNEGTAASTLGETSKVDASAPKPEVVDIPKAEGSDLCKVEGIEASEAKDLEQSDSGVVKKLEIIEETKPLNTQETKMEDCDSEPGISSKRTISPQEKDRTSGKKIKTETSDHPDINKKEEGSNTILSAAQLAKDVTEFELKRKRTVDADDRPIDILTVKKVKLDSADSVREEVKVTPQKLEVKTDPIPSDESKETKCKEPCKMNKRELDDHIVKRINLFLTQDEKSDIAVLKLKCEYLEKSVDKWKKKACTMQKQITEMHVALQRAIHVRKAATVPAKIQVPTRSVGLQVQLTSLHPLTDKQLPRHMSSHPPAGSTVKRLPVTSAGQTHMNSKGVSTSGSMAILNSGNTATPTLQSMISKPPLTSSTVAARSLYAHAATTVSGVQIPTVSTNAPRPNPPPYSSIAPRPSPMYTVAKPTTTGVSILQPRMTNSQPMTGPVVVTSVQPTTVPTSSFPKVASVIPPSSPTVRAMLDSRRMPQTMNPSGPPVPMRLVPNQAAVKQAGPSVRPPAPACQPGQAVASGPATPATVKIIDLTADEDEGNNLQSAQVQTIIPTVVSSASPTTLVQMTNQRPVTLIPASQAASMAGGQVFINTTPATGTVTVSTSSPMAVGMAAPIRTQAPPSTLIASQGQRVTYLVPSTMVRPTQPLYVTQPGVQTRPMQQMPQQMTQQNILKPPIQTILFQRGTTVYPVQGQPATPSQPIVRPTQPAILRTSQTAVVTPPQIPVQVQASSPRPSVPTLQVTPKQVVQRLGTPVTPSQNSEQSSGTPVVVSKAVHKHPAPLPPCAVDLDSSPSLKTPPPKPALKISRVNNGIVLSWNMSLTPKHAEIARYQLYAYQESNAPPSTTLWKKVGDVKALPLPMACTLTQFMEGHKYHFAVRAVDVHDRIGTFSDPGSIVLSSPTTPTTSAPIRL